MRCSCKKCGYQFESVILDQKEAFKEIVVKSTRHAAQKHTEIVRLVAQAVSQVLEASSQLLHFNEFIMVPEEEEFMQEQLTESQDLVMYAIGYVPGDEEEEEDGEDEDIEDEDLEIAPGVIELPSAAVETIDAPPLEP